MGRYAPGAPLRLQELTADFGVSLTPIREALRRLEVERLVENRPNRGAVVASISAAEVCDAYDTRILLEAEGLRRAWPHITSETLATARTTLDAMFSAFEDGRLQDAVDLHRVYHFDLWSVAGSDWLDHLIAILWSHTERYRNLALVLHTPARAAGEYHTAVLEALESSDLEAATRHTADELGKARDVVTEHLAGLEADDASQSA